MQTIYIGSNNNIMRFRNALQKLNGGKKEFVLSVDDIYGLWDLTDKADEFAEDLIVEIQKNGKVKICLVQ